MKDSGSSELKHLAPISTITTRIILGYENGEKTKGLATVADFIPIAKNVERYTLKDLAEELAKQSRDFTPQESAEYKALLVFTNRIQMNIVVLDGYTLNPGDLSWAPLQSLGHCEIYDRTPPDAVVQRAANRFD
ncbi:MAG: hypothetical protein ABFS56_14335 [Pseudomonadota bacterium]